VAAVTADRTGTILHANPATTGLLGWDPPQLIGAPITTLVPRRFLAVHRRAFAAWAADPEGRLDGHYLRLQALAADGAEVPIGMVLSPATGDGGEHLVVALVRPRDAEHEAVNAVALELVSVLSQELQVDETVQALLRAIGERLDWNVVDLWVVDADREVLRPAGLWIDDDGLEPFRTTTEDLAFALGEGLPGRVWATGAPVTVERIADDADFSRREPAAAAGLQTGFAFPVEHDGRLIGVIEMLRRGPEPIDAQHVAVLAGIGAHLGPYLDRARRRELEHRAEHRLRLINACTQRLARWLDYHAPLDELCELLVPAVAEACVIDLVREGRLERVGKAFADPEYAADVAMLSALVPLETVTAGPIAVVESGESLVHEQVEAEELARGLGDGVPADLIARLAPTSTVIAPLLGRGTVIGTVSLARRGGRFDDDDRRFAEELGRHLGLALANAALFERERAVATALQQSLLPPSLPEVPGLEVAARYEPGGTRLVVGGDFYDLFEVEEGCWLAMVGDVCGTGAEAAAITSQVRYSARALASRVDSPAELLIEVNAALLHRGDSRFCTALVARLDHRGDRVEVTLSSAGHPPPVLISHSGTRLVDCPGTLLGVYADATQGEVELTLEPGESLALYTDGVIETRDAGGQQLGEERLVEVLDACVDEHAEKTAEQLVQAAVEHSPFGPADDIAVLVLRAL
jgi:PAS domain S-box-containing protein